LKQLTSQSTSKSLYQAIEMCIRYNIEHWLPVSKEYPDWDRRVKRGLAQPGQNPSARVINFYECRGQFLKQARCPPHEIRQGGCYRGRTLNFCYQDDDCFLRLAELQSACTAAQREAEAMEGLREHNSIQANVTQKWKQAYEDWTSAYENHRDCPDRRYGSEIFRQLKRADVAQDQRYIPDDSRLSAHPSYAQAPVVGIQRHYDDPRPRY
jgi:hypothetical protein